MLICLFFSEDLGHQWQVKVSTKLVVIKTDSSFQLASEPVSWVRLMVDAPQVMCYNLSPLFPVVCRTHPVLPHLEPLDSGFK